MKYFWSFFSVKVMDELFLSLIGAIASFRLLSNEATSAYFRVLSFLALRDLVPDVHVLALRETTGTVVLDQRESNTVYEGDTALKLQASAEWEVLYTPNPPLEALGFESIRFAFHPGDVTASPQDMLQVSIVSGTVRTPSHRVDVDLDIKE